MGHLGIDDIPIHLIEVIQDEVVPVFAPSSSSVRHAAEVLLENCTHFLAVFVEILESGKVNYCDSFTGG